MKKLSCNSCGSLVLDCSDDSVAVLCPICVIESVDKDFPMQKNNIIKSDKPRGWHLMKQYIHFDGTVYEFGVENKELKNTMDPTKIKDKTKKKLTKKELEFNKLDIVNDIKKLKKKLKDETNPKQINKINKDINKKQIELSKIK